MKNPNLHQLIAAMALTALLSSPATTHADENSFNCENTGKCEQAAEICGGLAGIERGRLDCRLKQDPPHPDYVWVSEVKLLHCMGFLPIIATMYDEKLESAFKNAYHAAYAKAFQVAGCESAPAPQPN